jgi:probable phosphoglycerate mutase
LEILLIRCGDPDYANDNLTDRGVWESQMLASRLAKVEIDAIYVSPAGRAQDTCRYTCQRKNMQATTLDWLLERPIKRGSVYLWEAPGETFLQADMLPTLDDWQSIDGAMPEGREQYEVVGRGFDELLELYGYVRDGHWYGVGSASDKRIAIFAHKGVIMTLLARLLHWSMPMLYVSLEINCTGVTPIEMVEKGGHAHPKALAINDLSHLGSSPNGQGSTASRSM